MGRVEIRRKESVKRGGLKASNPLLDALLPQALHEAPLLVRCKSCPRECPEARGKGGERVWVSEIECVWE